MKKNGTNWVERIRDIVTRWIKACNTPSQSECENFLWCLPLNFFIFFAFSFARCEQALNIVFKLCVLFSNTISLWLCFAVLDGRLLNTLEWYFYCCSVFKSSSNILPPYLEDSITQWFHMVNYILIIPCLLIQQIKLLNIRITWPSRFHDYLQCLSSVITSPEHHHSVTNRSYL